MIRASSARQLTRPRLRPKLGWEAEEFLPANMRISEHEFFHLPTNRGMEYTDGFVEALPVPTEYHQSLLELLFDLLRDFIQPRKLGRARFAGIKVLLRPGKYREPDIVFMRVTNFHRRHNDYWDGADLVMEVVSPSNPWRDIRIKRAEYAEARIPEYWIVDPRKETITVLTLDGNKYRVHGEFKKGSKATSVLLRGFSVSVEDVFGAHE